MGNIGSVPINIRSTDNQCLTVADDIAKNQTNIVGKKCTGESDQIFQYNQETQEIRYRDKCISAEGNHVHLWPCHGGADQQWNLEQDGRLRTARDGQKCAEITDLGLHMTECTGNANQQFAKVVIDRAPSTIPRIVRNNLVIPEGILPVPQLSVLPANSVLFMNDKGNNVMISAEIVLDHNSKELTCLGTVDKFIIGPFTTLKVIYIDRLQSRQELVFRNGSAEHDLIYDMHTSFSDVYRGLIDRIVGFDIGGDGLCGILGSHIIDADVPSGVVLVSNYSGVLNPDQHHMFNEKNFSEPTDAFTVNLTQPKDYILGPYTMATLDNLHLYNSGDKPLFYSGLRGIETRGYRIRSYTASPLKSGYAMFTLNCDLSGARTTAVIGQYSIAGPIGIPPRKDAISILSAGSIGSATPSNPDWTGRNFYSNAPNTNPVKIIGNDKISGVVVGPYTRVVLFHDSQYQGTTKMFENNTSNEVSYDLCQEAFNNVTSSIKIEYSSSYIGFGLISLAPQTYKPMTYKEACESESVPLEKPVMALGKPIGYYIAGVLYDVSEGDMGSGMKAHPHKLYSPIEKQWKDADFDINCHGHGLIGFEPAEDDGKFYKKYTCSTELKYHNPTSLRTKPVAMDSLNNFTNVSINCKGKAITGVKTTIDGNNIVYQYLCGDRNLDDIHTYESQATTGYPSDLSSIMEQQVKCPYGELSSFKLESTKEKDTLSGPIFQYKFNYSCGQPSKKPGFHHSSTDRIIEGFDMLAEESGTDETLSLSFMTDGTEIHIAYPSDFHIQSRFPTDRIQFDANGIAIDLRQESGKIDTIICRGSPVVVENKDYVEMTSRPIEKSATEHSDWFYFIIIVTIVLIAWLIYRHYQK